MTFEITEADILESMKELNDVQSLELSQNYLEKIAKLIMTDMSKTEIESVMAYTFARSAIEYFVNQN